MILNNQVMNVPEEWQNPSLPAVERYYHNSDDLLRNNLWKIRQEFGTKGHRWWWKTVLVTNDETKTLEWHVKYIFKCAHDAVLFQLKY